MPSMNRAQILGHLGKDPEIRYAPSGLAIATFSIATTEKWKDKSGDQQEKTEWHNITCFDKRAEFAEKYLYKGQLVMVEGKITTEKWQDKEGKDRYTTKIIANNIMPMQWRDANDSPKRDSRPAAPEKPFEDDIPF